MEVRWTSVKKVCVNVLVDDDSDPGCISEESETIHADLFISLRCREDLVDIEYGGTLTATQNLSTSPLEVDMVARADTNQAFSIAPWTILESAPSTKNSGLLKIWVTRRTSEGS